MAKMTVYVPDDLKRRMDEVEGANWSAVACEAFDAKLANTISTRRAKPMSETMSRWDEVSGDIVRERLVRNGIEQVERRYAKYVSDLGKEPAVFVLNLLDEFGRMFAEGHVGKAEVDRRVNHADPEEITPVFYFLCGLEDAKKLTGTGEFEHFGDVPGFPVPPGKFLVIGISHKGMLFRWLPKPKLN
jgi:hypothetical protein